MDSLPEPIDFWDGNLDTASGEIAYGAIFDFGGERFLPPSADRTLVRFEFDVLALAGGATSIEPEDGLGTVSPISNLLVTQAAETIAPELLAGSLSIVVPDDYVPPFAEAGPDATAVEEDVVTLDGSASESPQGRQLAYCWSQLTEPLAARLTEPTVPRPRYSLPPVDGDTELVFELTVNDRVSEATDRVTVIVLDLDQRRGSVASDREASTGIVDGSRAILFSGVVRWESPVEDGEWSRVTFKGSGAGDESRLLGALSLHLDSDENGRFDESDRQIGQTTSVASDNDRITFDFSEPIPAGTSRRFFLVADIAAPRIRSAIWILLPVLLVAGGFAVRATRWRARTWSCLAIVALVGLPWIPGCGGGGGGGGGSASAAPSPSREVRFDIADPRDVDLHGVSSGVAAPVEGTPVSGPALEV